MSDMIFQLKRLYVCWLCWYHLRHWPMNDLDDAEWRAQLEAENAYDAFIEGWCREMEYQNHDE
jgi:hypothetical protein